MSEYYRLYFWAVIIKVANKQTALETTLAYYAGYSFCVIQIKR